jgi:hypothetical protein
VRFEIKDPSQKEKYEIRKKEAEKKEGDIPMMISSQPNSDIQSPL